MKLLGSDGYFEPRIQILFGIRLCIFLLVTGVWDVLESSSLVNMAAGFWYLLCLPAGIYIVWRGVRKQKNLQKPPE